MFLAMSVNRILMALVRMMRMMMKKMMMMMMMMMMIYLLIPTIREQHIMLNQTQVKQVTTDRDICDLSWKCYFPFPEKDWSGVNNL